MDTFFNTDTILVSCYYLVDPKPGRSHEKYKEWFNYMIKSLVTPLIIYTDIDSMKYLNVKNSLIKYEIVPFEELHYYCWGISFWEGQQKKDLNRTRSWKLSLLYNEKCYFIKRALTKYNANWFVWCDIGCFRDIKDFYFPCVNHLPENKMTLLSIEPFQEYEYNTGYIFHPERQIRIGGGVQIATVEVWNKWFKIYNDMFLHYVNNSTVNCDQSLLASIYMKHTDLINLINAKTTKYTVDKWFYLLEIAGRRELITILMPLYNGVEYLKEALNSVIEQTFDRWKVIIGINGHNYESTIFKTVNDILLELNDDRIIVKTYQTKGKVDTLNEMTKDCYTHWVSLLDVDDRWHTDKLREQVPYLFKYDVVGSLAKYFGKSNSTPSIPEGEIHRFHNFYESNPIINSSIIIRRIDALWIDRFYLEDYDLWLRLFKKNKKFYNVDKILTYHRIHLDSYFNSSGNQDVNELINYHTNNKI